MIIPELLLFSIASFFVFRKYEKYHIRILIVLSLLMLLLVVSFPSYYLRPIAEKKEALQGIAWLFIAGGYKEVIWLYVSATLKHSPLGFLFLFHSGSVNHQQLVNYCNRMCLYSTRLMVW